MSSNLTAARMWGRSAYPHPGKWLGTGNRCGHNPLKPKWNLFQIPKTKKREPSTQKKLMKGAHDYFYSPSRLMTLMNLNGRQNEDGSPRQNRSDGREPEALILLSILSYTDYASLRVGTPLPNGDFISRSCGEIAQRAGMLDASCDPAYPYPNKRFWRAWRRLKLAGAFKVHEQFEEVAPGVKRARVAIKNLNLDFLVSLGRVGYAEMKRFRDWCSGKITKARAIYEQQNPEASDAKAASRRVQLAAEKAGIKTHAKVKKASKVIEDSDQDKRLKEKYSRDRLAYQKELFEKSSDLGFAEIKRRVDRRYPPFEVWRKKSPD
jgi:hypothetical protein